MDPPHVNYVDYKSILVVNSLGKMKQIFVPFKVQVIIPTAGLFKNSLVIVEEIQSHEHYRLIYRITSYWYPYYCFSINGW